MRVCLWGTRGSIASAGPDTVRYGGNTACAEVEGRDGTVVILDAGTGVRRVGDTYHEPRRVDILLTHLHMDHIQGLGFFAPLFQKGFEKTTHPKLKNMSPYTKGVGRKRKDLR